MKPNNFGAERLGVRITVISGFAAVSVAFLTCVVAHGMQGRRN